MLTDPRSPFFQLAADLSRKAHDAALGNLHALVVPEAEKPPQKSRQTAKQAALELAYDRSQAAAAIVRAVQRWREALAGMSNTAPAEALDAVWESVLFLECGAIGGQSFGAMWCHWRPVLWCHRPSPAPSY